MPRALFMLAGAVLLLCAGLLVMNARENEARARAATEACTRFARYSQQPVDISHCTYVRRWDMTLIAFAGFALAGGLGFLAFGMSRRQVPG
jgi:hypothetical protein